MPLPTITLTGNLTADPELSFTQAGVQRTTFRVACNERHKNSDGEWVDGATAFISVTAWRALAEQAAEQLTKGTPVTVIGYLKSRTTENAEGTKQTFYDVDPFLISITLKAPRTPKPDSAAADPWADQTTTHEPPF